MIRTTRAIVFSLTFVSAVGLVSAGPAASGPAGARAAALAAAPDAQATASEPVAAVRAAIDEAVRLLEKKDLVGFVKTCLRPAELEELIAKFGSPERVAAEYAASGRPATMLTVLKATAPLTPTFSADGTIARFRFDAPVEGERGISLQRIGDRWYLRD